MTTGNDYQDYSRPVQTSVGPGWTGFRSQRVWTGANQTPGLLQYEEHPYHATVSQVRDGVFQWYYNTNPSVIYTATVSSWLGYPTFANPWTSNDDFILLQSLAAKVRKTEFNVGVSAAEGKRTLAYLADTTTRLGTVIHLVKKGDVRRAAYAARARRPRRVHEDVASNWLELQYAIRPLISDVYAAGQAAADFFHRPFRQSCRASLSRKTETVTQSFAKPKGYKTVRKGVIVRFEEDISQLASLGLLDPEVVLWEMVPYSFVADWIYPIGSWLETRGVLSALKSSVYITSVKSTGIVTSVSVPPSSGAQSKTLPLYYYKEHSFDRIIGVKPPTVPFPSRKPLSSIASWQHAATAVALAIQKISGRKVNFHK